MVKGLHNSQVAIRPGFISGLSYHEVTRSISIPPLDWMLVHRRVTATVKFTGTHYTLGTREAQCEVSVLPKNTTQCRRTGLEPGPLDQETSALTS